MFFSLKQPRVCSGRRHVGVNRPTSQRNFVPRCSPRTFPLIFHTQLEKPNDPEPLPIPRPFPPGGRKDSFPTALREEGAAIFFFFLVSFRLFDRGFTFSLNFFHPTPSSTPAFHRLLVSFHLPLAEGAFPGRVFSAVPHSRRRRLPLRDTSARAALRRP